MGAILADPLVAVDPGSEADKVVDPITPTGSSEAGDQAAALSALVNLGYGQGDAAGAVAQAAGAGATSEAALIRAALKLLAPQG